MKLLSNCSRILMLEENAVEPNPIKLNTIVLRKNGDKIIIFGMKDPRWFQNLWNKA